MKSDILEFQKKLSNFVGIPGHEFEVAHLIQGEIKDLVDKSWIDPLGNVLAIKEGTDPKQKILLDAHMDEVGFVVIHIDSKGFLRFLPLGGFDQRILLAQAVLVRNSEGKIFHGIIGSTPPHILSQEAKKKPITVEDLYIDLGMKSKEEVESHNITIGSTVVLHSEVVDLPNNLIRARALDDRLGCNVIVQVLKKLRSNPIRDTVVVNFSVQEEVGLRGAGPGAYTLDPTMAVAVETTTAADVPGVKEQLIPTSIGKGPAISIIDRTTISSHQVNKRMIENAKLEHLKYQFKRPASGGNNAGQIHKTRGGIPSTSVSVPVRYLHSPVSIANLEDAEGAVNILEAFLRNKANIET